MNTQTPVDLLDDVIRSRKSVRSFLPDPVPRRQLEEIIEAARMAPSTFNTQPWRVYVLAGQFKRGLSEAIMQSHAANPVAFSPFPEPVPAVLTERQGEFGRRCLAALGIDRTDMVARTRSRNRNYLFYDASIGLIFTINGSLTKHSWLDYGLFLQNLMLAAQARGLATCPQVSFVPYQSVIASYLRLPPDESVVCGMSLGFADKNAAINQVDMPREPLESFTQWMGFDVEAS
jgi:nitroreductase